MVGQVWMYTEQSLVQIKGNLAGHELIQSERILHGTPLSEAE